MVLVWVAAVLVTAVAYLALPLLPWGVWLANDKLAAWVQAVGSIVAILAAATVALWQTFSERRRIRRQEEAMARVAGSGVLLLVTPIVAMLDHVDGLLSNALDGPVKQLSAAFETVELVTSVVYPSRDDLLLLAAVLPGCATQLVRGRSLLVQFERAIDLCRRQGNAGLAVQGMKSARSLMPLAASQYKEARAELSAFFARIEGPESDGL